MGFHTFDGIYILIKGVVPPLFTFQYEDPVTMYFLLLFSRTLCMRPSLLGSVVPSLKPFVGVVGVLIVFLLLGLYHLDRHKLHQEWLLYVGLQLNL